MSNTFWFVFGIFTVLVGACCVFLPLDRLERMRLVNKGEKSIKKARIQGYGLMVAGVLCAISVFVW